MPPALYSLFYALEIVIRNNYLGSLLGQVRSASHGYADIGLLKCRNIIDAVTCHCHQVAVLAERFNYLHLLQRTDSGKHSLVPYD